MGSVQVNVPYPMLLERIDFVTGRGIHPEIYLSGIDLDRCHEEDLKKIAQHLEAKDLEVTIHGPFMDLSPGGVDPKIKGVTFERMLRTIEVAKLFRPKVIVFHPGYDKWRFDGDVRLWLESSLETWPPLVEKAEAAGLILALENVFEETPESLQALLEKIDSPNLGFCFDTGHHNVFSSASFVTWAKSLGPYLKEVHLHDNRGEKDEHLPLGEGTFDFAGFFALLRQLELRPTFTIEPHEEPHLWRSLEAVKKYIG